MSLYSIVYEKYKSALNQHIIWNDIRVSTIGSYKDNTKNLYISFPSFL